MFQIVGFVESLFGKKQQCWAYFVIPKLLEVGRSERGVYSVRRIHARNFMSLGYAPVSRYLWESVII